MKITNIIRSIIFSFSSVPGCIPSTPRTIIDTSPQPSFSKADQSTESTASDSTDPPSEPTGITRTERVKQAVKLEIPARIASIRSKVSSIRSKAASIRSRRATKRKFVLPTVPVTKEWEDYLRENNVQRDWLSSIPEESEVVSPKTPRVEDCIPHSPLAMSGALYATTLQAEADGTLVVPSEKKESPDSRIAEGTQAVAVIEEPTRPGSSKAHPKALSTTIQVPVSGSNSLDIDRKDRITKLQATLDSAFYTIQHLQHASRADRRKLKTHVAALSWKLHETEKDCEYWKKKYTKLYEALKASEGLEATNAMLKQAVAGLEAQAAECRDRLERVAEMERQVQRRGRGLGMWWSGGEFEGSGLEKAIDGVERTSAG